MTAKHFVYALTEGLQVRYVGYSASLAQRRQAHKISHPDWKLLTLGAYPSREIGLLEERAWIARLYAAGHPLINKSDGGEMGYPIGRAASNLTRARMSAAKLGRTMSHETKAKISAANTGKPRSAEYRAKISAAKIGKPGHLLSTENKAKLLAANLGKPMSDRTKAKISAAHLGKSESTQTKAKISAGHRGKSLSPKHKANLSAAKKAWWKAKHEAELHGEHNG